MVLHKASPVQVVDFLLLHHCLEYTQQPFLKKAHMLALEPFFPCNDAAL